MASDHLFRAAAGSGDLAAVLARLEAGAALESRHRGTGRTALLEAVIAGHTDVVALLLDRGADPDVSCTAVGETPLGWAANEGHPEIARLLLARGVAVDAVADNSFLKRTPFLLAAQSGHVEVLQILLDGGADLSAVDGRGDNALSLARERQQAGAVALLLAAGAADPAPVEDPDPLPWPELAWDPCALDGVAALPPGASPAEVVVSYIRALHRWSIEAWPASRAAIDRGEAFDISAELAAAERLTALHTTGKVRRYHRGSISFQPDLTPDFVLVEITSPTSARQELLVRHPSPEDFLHEYEWTFVCLRRRGEWRIDSARNRLRGTETWSAAIL